MEKFIVGSEEWCSFSELQIPAIKARIDSGAKTSSIHAINIKPFKKNNEKWVRYEVYPLLDNRMVCVHCESKVVDIRRVKSSLEQVNGAMWLKTPLTLGGSTWDIEMTLADRENHGF